jgi:cytoskeletal protein CcmA (bactofilin family)
MTVGGTYTQTGNVTATSITVNNAATINGVASINSLTVGGAYNQTGSLTLQSAAITGNTVINGVANLGAMTVGGTYTQTGNVTATSITVGGIIRLNGEIRTINDQIWTANNQIILTGTSKLNAGRDASNAIARISNIVLGGKVYSEGGNFDLTIDATGDVVIANDIGSAPGVNRLIGATVDNTGLINQLRVIAGNEINLLADITTKNLQEYSAISTNIGSVAGTSLHNQLNWGLTGANKYQTLGEGYMKESNPDLVRTLISVDPIIRFKGAVNDTIEGTHSLVALSISRVVTQDADIIFESTVGAERKLYSLTVRTLEYLERFLSPTVRGTIILGGNVSTIANQTYSTTMFEVTGNSAVVLSSESGTIRIQTPAYKMTVGISLDYSFSKPPEISSAPGLIRLADILRDVPSNDFTAGSLSNKLMRMAIPLDMPSDGVDAEVSVGDLEASDESLECKPGDQRAACTIDANI